MEPENTPLEKENHIPNHHFQLRFLYSLIFGGVSIYMKFSGCFYTAIPSIFSAGKILSQQLPPGLLLALQALIAEGMASMNRADLMK